VYGDAWNFELAPKWKICAALPTLQELELTALVILDVELQIQSFVELVREF
jgi:hypothetical protein